MTVEVRVPALGESVTEATVATWFKKPGDRVAADEMLCELETDKVTVEVPAPAAGTLGDVVAPEGSTVGPNALLATISEGTAASAQPAAARATSAPVVAEAPGVGVAPQDSPATAPATAAEGAPTGPAASYSGITPEEAKASTPSRTELERASYAQEIKDRAAARDVADAPSAVKMMADKGVARDAVEGTGRDGRIMKEDVLRAVQQPKAAPEAPKPAPVPRAPTAAQDVGREERVRMTRLRQTIARRLKEAQNTAAMLTTYNEVDMSAVMAIRAEYKDAFEKKHRVKLGFMSFFVKACVHALLEVPEVNAEIDGEDVVYKRYVHMGVAVGTPSGLVVPVVRDVQDKGFAQIEKEIGDLGARARDGKLAMADMQGGTFTISNGGVYGSLMSSPILNPPQSGILGMHKIQDRPVVVGGQVVVRPMMYLALSYDHRIVDGKGAVTFLVRVKEAIEDPRRLLMDL
jgi:2-oxoglutarate dehydrogenase E2 component (dihydrolipoamide succinyltransferase)